MALGPWAGSDESLFQSFRSGVKGVTDYAVEPINKWIEEHIDAHYEDKTEKLKKSPPSHYKSDRETPAYIADESRRHKVWGKYLTKAIAAVTYGQQPGYGHEERKAVLDNFHKSEYYKRITEGRNTLYSPEGYEGTEANVKYPYNYRRGAYSKTQIHPSSDAGGWHGPREPGISWERAEFIYPPSIFQPTLPREVTVWPEGWSTKYGSNSAEYEFDYYMLLTRHLMEQDGLNPTDYFPNSIAFKKNGRTFYGSSDGDWVKIDTSPYRQPSPTKVIESLKTIRDEFKKKFKQSSDLPDLDGSEGENEMAFATGYSFAPPQPGMQNPYGQPPAGFPGGYYPGGPLPHGQRPPQGQQPMQGQNPQPGQPAPQNTQPGAPPPPPLPSMEDTNRFLPSILADPYVNAINNSQQMANWASQAVPGAAAFHAGMYSPGMTAMEQAYAGSAAELGSRNLAATHNRLAGMFENSASHGSLAPAFLDATNQFNAQMNQMIGQMGTQRQGMAAQMTPFTFGFPIQAGQAGMQGAQGLYDMAQNAMYGDLSFPLAMIGTNPFMVPTVVAS